MAIAGHGQTHGQEAWPWQGMDRHTDIHKAPLWQGTDRRTADPARLSPSGEGCRDSQVRSRSRDRTGAGTGRGQGKDQEGLEGTALAIRLHIWHGLHISEWPEYEEQFQPGDFVYCSFQDSASLGTISPSLFKVRNM